MNQEPVLIKGVVAFPNPNGNREIRFIDAFYHDLFKIPDHSSIVINYLDGGKRCVPCEYMHQVQYLAINHMLGNRKQCCHFLLISLKRILA